MDKKTLKFGHSNKLVILHLKLPKHGATTLSTTTLRIITQHNNTQHNGLIYDTEHKRHSV
jgi:hypothetical protein